MVYWRLTINYGGRFLFLYTDAPKALQFDYQEFLVPAIRVTEQYNVIIDDPGKDK